MWSRAFSRGDAATRSQTVSGPIGDKERSGPGTARGSASCFLLAAGVALGLGLAGCVNISKNTGMPLEFEAALLLLSKFHARNYRPSAADVAIGVQDIL